VTEEFWEQYDTFCEPNHLQRIISGENTDLQKVMCTTMRDAHKSRGIYDINRPKKGWQHRKAWLALRNEPVRNDRGDPAFYVRVGDVAVIEFGWDSDNIITHCPPRCVPGGYLLSGKWNEMIGLFMPLFDRATIERCIELRMAQNVRDTLILTEKASQDWRWY
jgi:hypothetical protein